MKHLLICDGYTLSGLTAIPYDSIVGVNSRGVKVFYQKELLYFNIDEDTDPYLSDLLKSQPSFREKEFKKFQNFYEDTILYMEHTICCDIIRKLNEYKARMNGIDF